MDFQLSQPTSYPYLSHVGRFAPSPVDLQHQVFMPDFFTGPYSVQPGAKLVGFTCPLTHPFLHCTHEHSHCMHNFLPAIVNSLTMRCLRTCSFQLSELVHKHISVTIWNIEALIIFEAATSGSARTS